MKYFVVLFPLFIILVVGDRHLNANGPFGKRHAVGDEPSPHACDRGSGVSISSKTLTITNINVSSTTYSSNEQIIITWTSLSNPCADDFVGIYFVEIDLSAGKRKKEEYCECVERCFISSISL